MEREIDDDCRIVFPLEQTILFEKPIVNPFRDDIVFNRHVMLDVVAAAAEKRQYHRGGGTTIEIIVKINIVLHGRSFGRPRAEYLAAITHSIQRRDSRQLHPSQEVEHRAAARGDEAKFGIELMFLEEGHGFPAAGQ